MWRQLEAATCLSKDDLAQRKLFVKSKNATVMNSSLRLRLLRRRKGRRGAIRFVSKRRTLAGNSNARTKMRYLQQKLINLTNENL